MSPAREATEQPLALAPNLKKVKKTHHQRSQTGWAQRYGTCLACNRLWVLCLCSPHPPPPPRGRGRGLALKSVLVSWAWWHNPLVPAHRKQKQTELCEFKASLVNTMNSRPARDSKRVPLSNQKCNSSSTTSSSSNKQTNGRQL